MTKFYNDRAYEVVDSASIEKQFNALPKLARSQWSLDGERTAYGGVTEGFDIGLLDVTLTNGRREVVLKGALTDKTDTYTFSEVQTPVLDKFIIYDYTSQALASLPASGTTPWTIVFDFDGELFYGEYNGSVLGDYRDAVLATVNLAPIFATLNGSNQIVFGDNTAHSVEINIWDTNDADEVTKVKSFKTNSDHPFCIFYYDDVRRSDPQTQVNATTIFIPALPEVGGFTGTNWQQYVGWAIAHDAPSWAKYWGWGYAGNRSIAQFWQYNIVIADC